MVLQPTSSHYDDVRDGTLGQIFCRYKTLRKTLYGVDCQLPVLDSTSVREYKSHLALPLSKLGPNESSASFGAKASDFLFRKLLPSPRDDPIPGYLEKLGQVPVIDPDFVRAARHVIPQLFPIGWDEGYAELCEVVTIKPSSCTEKGQGSGGSREFCRQFFADHDGYVRACRDGENVQYIPDIRRVMVLCDGCKKRIVTVASGLQSQLLPLHKAMYNRLSRYRWLLRGDAGLSSMDGFRREPDAKEDVFVSGDYEAATDNLNAAHSKLLLRFIRQQSRFIPDAIWDIAIDSMTGRVLASGPEEVGCKFTVLEDQSNGQMMGNRLSFPLLCIVNYIGVVLAFGEKKTLSMSKDGILKINGDDIVFRTTLDGFETWKGCVSKAGLVLSPGKTLIHKRFFSINSTFFAARMNRSPLLVPVIRPATIYEPCTFLGLEGKMKSGSWGFFGWKRSVIQGEILRWHHRVVATFASGGPWCSLTRGLGIRCKPEALQKGSGSFSYLKREQSILDAPAGLDSKPFQEQNVDGKGWVPTARRIPFRSYPARLFDADHRQLFDEKFRDWSVAVTWERPDFFRPKPDKLRERSRFIYHVGDSYLAPHVSSQTNEALLKGLKDVCENRARWDFLSCGDAPVWRRMARHCCKPADLIPASGPGYAGRRIRHGAVAVLKEKMRVKASVERVFVPEGTDLEYPPFCPWRSRVTEA